MLLLRAGYDPNLKSALKFCLLSIRATASYSDTIVSRANNADLFFAKIVTLVPQAAIVTVTGDHGDKSGIYSTGCG